MHMQLEVMVKLENGYLQLLFNHTSVYTEAEIEHALYSRDAFIEYNQEHPGGFFIVIITGLLQTFFVVV